MTESLIIYAVLSVVMLVLGWIGARAAAKYAPSEREVVFKMAAEVTKRIAALQSTAPDLAAAAAAQAASEAVTLQQFKEAVASLK